MSNYQNWKSTLVLLHFHEQQTAQKLYTDFNTPQMTHPFRTVGCAVEPLPGACSKSDSGVLFGSWLAQYPPGSGTKAQLSRKRLQFPPCCVTNTLLCLLPKPQPHGTQCSAGIFPLKKHTNSSSSNLPNLSFTSAAMASSFTAPVTVYGDSYWTVQTCLGVWLFVISKDNYLFGLSFGSFISDLIPRSYL